MHQAVQYDSPIGPLALTADENGLLSIEFSKTKKRDHSEILNLAQEELSLYFSGKLSLFSVPLSIKGTVFQKKCWELLLDINYAETISYKEMAIRYSEARYARAVASANNKNKIPIIIPCHRVLGIKGDLVGYAGGINVKKQLLELESRSV